MLTQLRAVAQQAEANRYYVAFFFVAICVNGVTLGLETSRGIMETWAPVLLAADLVFRVVFVFEILVRWLAEGKRFWKQGWNLFDVAVVSISLFPYLSLLSAIRVIRLFKLLRVVSEFRRNTESLRRAVIAARAAILMLLLVMYVYSVMSSKFFGETHPELFGDVFWSMNAHADMLLGEGVGMLVIDLVAAGYSRWVQLYLWLYVGITLFVLVSFLIAMIVEGVQKVTNEHLKSDNEKIRAQLEEIQKSIVQLRADSK